MNLIDRTRLPFIYGAQYYRAPTPEPEYWERDLAHLKRLGGNTVKFWVQWRWSERRPGEYVWDDLDRLMELAQKYELKVILNLICDVMPSWSEILFPDCVMVDRHNQKLATSAVICRQLGGYPGPCYNHPGMLAMRHNFFAAALAHFNQFDSLFAWDVWNEPERHLGRRSADDLDHLLCYCPHCEAKFKLAMERQYGSIADLNRRWGRCYNDFAEVELPRDPATVADYIDWREFQLDCLTGEARWRLAAVKKTAPGTLPHLHVVPHTIDCFNSTNCVDDFALAKDCEIFGSTMMYDPLFAAAASSAAGDKFFYNAEWHINFGSTAMHPRVIDRTTFLCEAIPQLAWDVKGIMYWQFRPETIGFESPGWGMILPDGTDRPVSLHAAEFIAKLTPYLPKLLKARRTPPAVAVLKSRRNELFFDAFPKGKGNWLYRSIRGYADALLDLNLAFRFISAKQLEDHELAGIKLLILPAAYYLSKLEAEAIDEFCRSGGSVLAEGTVAGYCHDTGRHSNVVPGCHLAGKWGIREIESTSSYHLDCQVLESSESGAAGDTAKALSSIGPRGDEYFPLTGQLGQGFGALTLSTVASADGNILAAYRDNPCIVEKTVGAGHLFYAGTYLGIAAAEKSAVLLKMLLRRAAEAAKIKIADLPEGVRLTRLCLPNRSAAEFMVAENVSVQEQQVPVAGQWLDVFDGNTVAATLRLLPKSAVLLKTADIDQ